MTVKIEQIYLREAKAASVVNFMKSVTETILELGEEGGDRLKEAFENYRDCDHWKANSPGRKKMKIDQEVDHFWRSTKAQLKLNMTHPDEEVSEAAKEIYEAFVQIPDPTRLKYQEQYGALEILIPKMESFGEEKLEAAFVLGWVRALRMAYDNFRTHLAEDATAVIADAASQNKRLREALIETYMALVERINAKNLLEPTPKREELAKRLNILITRFKQSEKASARMKSKATLKEA